MSEINLKKEISWLIKDIFPIQLFVKKAWSNEYYIITARTMKISYSTWEDLDLNHEVDISTYNYETGEATWTAYTLEQIIKWENKNKDKIVINYSQVK